ncbi:MAG: type II toxin-antitoxin system ParD family antitoxin [Candidatus Hinthialibacter antarcticus]|nr:type II toxin-antitoxin system ParD family antitoxin [Candidatus Hinthialibacter antarcticus]
MHVSLTERLEEFVKEKVESGLYNNSSEVVREALRLLEQEDQLRKIKLERLRDAIRVGDEQFARGEFSNRTIDDIIADNEAAAKKSRK